MRLTPNASGAADLNITGTVNVSGNINLSSGSSTFQGRGSGITDLNAFNLASGTVPAARLSGNYAISVTGNVTGNLTGNTQGTHTGPVIGNVTGTASGNLAAAGGTLTGDLNWATTGRGLTWGMNSDGASIRFYNTSDGDTASRLEFQTTDNGNEYFSWTHAVSGGGTVEAMRLVPNTVSGTSSLRIFGNVTVDGTASGTFSGTGTGLTINAGNLTNGTVPSARLAGTYAISITGNANSATTASTATNQAGGSVNATTGSFSGRVAQSVSGFHAASKEVISTRTDSGFYDWSAPTTANGWPVNGSWHHLLSSTHVNDANYYAMQFSADFYTQNLYYRSTGGNGATAWNKILHANNYNDYAPTKAGGGATGTWAINISGSAGSAGTVPWTGVTGKPSIVLNDGNTYGINISGNANTASSTPVVNNAGNITAESNGTGEPSGLRLRSVYSNGYPTSYGNAITLGGAGGGELLIGWSGSTGAHADNYVRSRRDTGNVWSAWAKLITDVNYNSYAPSLTGSGASGTWSINVTGNAATVTTVTSGQITGGLGYTPISQNGGTVNGYLDFLDNNLIRPTIKDYSLAHNALGNVSGGVTVNMELGNYASATAVGALTWTFANPPTGARVGSIILELTNGGAYTQYWPAAVKWPSGSAPSLAAAGVDVLVFITDDGGSNWRGAISMGDSR
jgi:hypothetical protein